MFVLKSTGKSCPHAPFFRNNLRPQLIPKRHAKKGRRAVTFRRPADPHEVAKDFFDHLYSKKFGQEWPSIRCALLSRKKYAAVVNNRNPNMVAVEDELLESGATDIVGKLRDNAIQLSNRIKDEIDDVEHTLFTETQQMEKTVASHHGDIEQSDMPVKEGGAQIMQNGAHRETAKVSSPKQDVPSDEDPGILDGYYKRLDWLQKQLDIYEKLSQTCTGLKAYAYPKRNLTELEDPMDRARTQNLLDYFLLDGASILPVLALNPEPKDHVLDMCAAPGGKLVCILQLCGEGPGSVIANDISSLRMARIRKVQGEYIPKDSPVRQRMKVMNADATAWHEMETATYDKVLVDVPCTQDRHSVIPTLQARDNIFSPLRKRERANLPQLQSDILRNGIMACRPGGTIVYSTCTLSKQQNEYVVQMTIQHLLQKYGITCEIEDLTPMSNLLTDHYKFFDESTLGTLVLPQLESNFGPTYVCKIIRIR